MIELTMEQGTIEWHEARSGIVTSTSLKSATGKPGPQNTLMYKLLGDRMAQQVFDNVTSTAMQHGKDTEEMARQAACRSLNKEFRATGMLMSSIIKGFGISPDGVYDRDGLIVGGVEIKCPNSNKHIEYIINNQVPDEYWHQFLAPFVLSDQIEFWTFMSFDYRNYHKPEFYVTLKRADVEQEVMRLRTYLKTFIKMVDDQHSELCGFGTANIEAAESEPATGNCKDCNSKLTATDALLWGDRCNKCVIPQQ